jgi:hypothetical protein
MTVLGSLRVPTLNVHQKYESLTVYMTKFVIICDLHMTRRSIVKIGFIAFTMAYKMTPM